MEERGEITVKGKVNLYRESSAVKSVKHFKTVLWSWSGRRKELNLLA